MIAAWRLPGARFVTVEAQAESVALARKSAVRNGLTDRCDIRQGDFRDGSMLRADERFDLVLGRIFLMPCAIEHGWSRRS